MRKRVIHVYFYSEKLRDDKKRNERKKDRFWVPQRIHMFVVGHPVYSTPDLAPV